MTYQPNTLGNSQYQPLTLSTNDFNRAQTTLLPLPTRSNLTANGALAARTLYFSDYFDPSVDSDCTTALQNFLLYCQLVALELKNTGLDDLFQNGLVTAVLPRGYWRVSCPLIIPEYVRLHCEGIVIRGPNWLTSGATSFYNGDTTSQALNYVMQPVLIFTPRSGSEFVQFYCNPDGNSAHQGNGMVSGKTWSAASLNLISGGTNYVIGDIITGNQPSKFHCIGFQIIVDSVSGSGAIETWHFNTSAISVGQGAYALPPVLQNSQWTSTNGFVDVNTGNPIFTSDGSAVFNTNTNSIAGSGATFTINWTPDFASSSLPYYTGAGGVIMDIIHGHIRYQGVPILNNGSNISFGVCFSNLNQTIDDISGTGGYAGVRFIQCSDVRVNVINPVNPSVGIAMNSAGSIHCPNCVLDTPIVSGLNMDESSNINLKGTIFNGFNINGVPFSPTVSMGLFSSSNPNTDIDLDFILTNVGSGINLSISAALQIAYTQSSRIRLAVSNDSGTGTPAPTALNTVFAQIGDGVGSSVILEGFIDHVPTSLFINNTSSCSFTGYISGTNLTVSAISSGSLAPGQILYGGNSTRPAQFTQIISQTSGTTGSTGVYVVNTSQTMGSSGSQVACTSFAATTPPAGCNIYDAYAAGYCGSFGVYTLYGSGAPTNGTTGLFKANIGSNYYDTTNGAYYISTSSGTIASPAWSHIT